MFRVPSSTILSMPDSGGSGGSDASVSDFVRTPSDSDEADDFGSFTKLEDNLKKRVELQREYRKQFTVLRAESDDIRRRGRRLKHKWSSVKISPSEKSVNAAVQIQVADATSPTQQKAKNWAKSVQHRNLEEQRKMAAQHPTMAATVGDVEPSGKNIHTGQEFNMTQNASEGVKVRANAAYVDPVYFSDPCMQFTKLHTVSPVLPSATSTFHQAAGANQATHGGYLPTHLRKKMNTSSKSEVSFTAEDQVTAASTAQKEQKKRFVERIMQTLRTQKTKDLAERGLEREGAAEHRLRSKNKQCDSWTRYTPQATIRNTSGPEIESATANAITMEQSGPLRQYAERDSRLLRQLTSLNTEMEAAESQPLASVRKRIRSTETSICQLKIQQEQKYCSCDDRTSSKPCQAHSQSPTTLRCYGWGAWGACGTCTDCIHQQDKAAAAFMNDTSRKNDESMSILDSLSNGLTCSGNSKNVTADTLDIGLDNSEYLERRMLEDFPDDHSALSRNPTPALVALASSQEAQQGRNTDDGYGQSCWCDTCCPSLYESNFSKSNNEDLGAKVQPVEYNGSFNCHSCLCALKSGPSFQHCPGCGQSSGLHTRDAASSNVAEGMLRTVLESITAEERTPQYLTPLQKSCKPKSDPPETVLKHAWEVLELQRYKSVDLSTLQKHLCKAMKQSSNYTIVGTAFATISRHQDDTGCWDLRLRWTDGDDKILQYYVVDGQLKDHEWLAVDLRTSVEDCFLRWGQIKPQDDPFVSTSTAIIAPSANEPFKTTYPDGWNAELDEKLLDMKTNLQTYSAIATELGKSVSVCRSRFRKIRTKNWKPKSLRQIEKEAPKTVWTPQLDRILVSLKEKNTTWNDIHEVLDMAVSDCKARFKEIAPEGWEPRSSTTKGGKNSPAELSTSEGDDEVGNDLSNTQHGDGWSAPSDVCGLVADDSNWGRSDVKGDTISSKNEENKLDIQYQDCGCIAGAWCFCYATTPGIAEVPRTTADMSKEHTYNCSRDRCDWYTPIDVNTASKDPQAAADAGSPAEDGDGWALPGDHTPSPHDCDCDWWGPCLHHRDSAWGASDITQPQAVPHPPYTVTYWATIESGSKEIHVPIDSKNVCGAEKTVVDGGMQKVWKWVHDKGLAGRIGLQDAFDLAQAMHEGEQVEEVETKKVGRRWETESEMCGF